MDLFFVLSKIVKQIKYSLDFCHYDYMTLQYSESNLKIIKVHLSIIKLLFLNVCLLLNVRVCSQ